MKTKAKERKEEAIASEFLPTNMPKLLYSSL